MLAVDPASSSVQTGKKLASCYAQMEKEARRDLQREGFSSSQIKLQRRLAVRYRGQSFELEVEYAGNVQTALAQFHRLHHARYGHSDATAALEIVSARLRGIGLTEKPELKAARKQIATPSPITTALTRLQRKAERLPVFDRETLPVGFVWQQPALIVEYGSTTLVPNGWQVTVDKWKNLLLQKRELS